MRRGMLAVAVAVTSTRGIAQATPDPSGVRIAAQVATSTLLTPAGFIAAGWAGKTLGMRAGWPTHKAARAGYIAAYVGAAAAAATGAALVGNHGKWPVAFLGAAAGIGGSVVTARLGNSRYDQGKSCGVVCWTLGGLTVSLPGIGATLAYNASRR